MMSFHPQKCQLLRITRKKSQVRASYVIHGHTLAETDTAKYLGVSLYKYLFWSPHVNATAKKANGNRAFLQRNLSKAPTAVKTRTYESLIRPIIEYSSVAQDVNKRDGPTPVRPLHIPGLWSNQQRHCHPENSRLGTPSGTPRECPHHHDVHLYIIVHGIVNILASDHIIQAPVSRRNGNAQFRVPYTRTLSY